MRELDEFVHQHCGAHIFDEEYPWPREDFEEDVITMTLDQVFDFLTMANHRAFKLVEFAADEKLYALWLPAENNYYHSPEVSSDKLYLICYEQPEMLVDEYLSNRYYDYEKLFEVQGSLEELSDSPSLLKAIIAGEESLSYDESTQTLCLTRCDSKAVMAIQPLLKQPLFEIREVTTEQINEIQQSIEDGV